MKSEIEKQLDNILRLDPYYDAEWMKEQIQSLIDAAVIEAEYNGAWRCLDDLHNQGAINGEVYKASVTRVAERIEQIKANQPKRSE